MPTLKYDWIESAKAGVTDHPQKVVESLGYIVTAYEAIGIADCSMIEVSDKVIHELPDYIELTAL